MGENSDIRLIKIFLKRQSLSDTGFLTSTSTMSGLPAPPPTEKAAHASHASPEPLPAPTLPNVCVSRGRALCPRLPSCLGPPPNFLRLSRLRGPAPRHVREVNEDTVGPGRHHKNMMISATSVASGAWVFGFNPPTPLPATALSKCEGRGQMSNFRSWPKRIRAHHNKC